ncbi:MAG: hypothetical protein JXR76_21075 [Deltaproteobacteria bacterium]|nr:hypothetical protein [Deltaproteobacteria bacterium]
MDERSKNSIAICKIACFPLVACLLIASEASYAQAESPSSSQMTESSKPGPSLPTPASKYYVHDLGVTYGPFTLEDAVTFAKSEGVSTNARVDKLKDTEEIHYIPNIPSSSQAMTDTRLKPLTQPPSTGLGLRISGAIALGVGGTLMALTPACVIVGPVNKGGSDTAKDLQSQCLLGTLGGGLLSIALGVTMLSFGLKQKHLYQNWQRREFTRDDNSLIR